ncbi:Uncharacterised protein [Mycobacteroides abscessus subsp. abscessus]|nr:Uncharacterised protein [Mycobacteroides abscessus subsp. abscessus]
MLEKSQPVPGATAFLTVSANAKFGANETVPRCRDTVSSQMPGSRRNASVGR